MTAERDSMTLNEVSYSALGASSLRSSPPTAAAPASLRFIVSLSLLS